MEIKNYKGVRPIQNLFEGLQLALENNVVPDTLFDVEPVWEKLREQRCPICGTKLGIPLKGKVAICRGKRHGDRKPFLISISKLYQIMARNKA